MEDKNKTFFNDLLISIRKQYKKCVRCGHLYPRTHEFFYKRSTSRDGYDYWCKECKREYDKNRNEKLRLNKYKITAEEYEMIRIKQENKCAICGINFDYLRKIKKDIVPRTGKPRIDHDHQTNKIRGLLCLNCNRALGRCKENPLILIKVVKYLCKNKNQINKT